MNDEYDNHAGGEEDVYVAEPDEGFYDDEMLGDLPGWPKPVGILSIVFGGISLTCGGIGVVYFAFLVPTMLGLAESELGAAPDVLKNVPIGVIASQGISLLVQILLIMAGITCLSRKIVTRPMHLAYAVAMIIVGAWVTYANMQWQASIGDWIAQNPDNEWAVQQSASQQFSGIGTIIGVLLMAAWPILLLVWFGLVKKTEDDLTGGALEAAA